MKRTLFLLATGILIIMGYNLSISIYTLWQKRDVIVNAQKELEEQKRENKELKKQYEEAKKPQFIEQEARDKLLLVKPGESEVILPPISPQAPSSNKNSSLDKAPNWQKWWKLFF